MLAVAMKAQDAWTDSILEEIHRQLAQHQPRASNSQLPLPRPYSLPHHRRPDQNPSTPCAPEPFLWQDGLRARWRRSARGHRVTRSPPMRLILQVSPHPSRDCAEMYNAVERVISVSTLPSCSCSSRLPPRRCRAAPKRTRTPPLKLVSVQTS